MISLAAKGLTTGEMAAHFADVYGTEVSRDTILRITERVLEEMAAWQNRPLDSVYPVVFVVAIHVKDPRWVGDGSEGAKYFRRPNAATA